MNATWFPPGAADGWLANNPQTMRGVLTKGGPSNPDLANEYLNYFGLQKAAVSPIGKLIAQFWLIGNSGML